MCASSRPGLAELVRAAGERAGKAAARVPNPERYPSLTAWLVLADVLSARGLMMQLDHEAHETFVRAYQAAIDASRG